MSAHQEVEVSLDTTVIPLTSAREEDQESQGDPDHFSTNSVSFEENLLVSHRNQLLELAFCFLFASVSHILLAVQQFMIDPHQRPIPYQLLNSTQEYVRNLVNDQKISEETVGAGGLAAVALIPILVQL